MSGYPTPELKGVIPNVFEHVFSKVTLDETSKHLIRASFIEIYLEEVRDLLAPDPTKVLEIRQKKTKSGEDEFFIPGLVEFQVENPKELERILKAGSKNRVTEETGMNARSSRSHAIFTLVVETKTESSSSPGTTHVRVGRLNLVDLAGSERQSKTGASGRQLAQAIEINKSLVTLGIVINQLVEGASHVSYRDSKLTKLLSNSLGGSCKTVMIANISPASFNRDETVGTLRYAANAKKIKNTPKINEDPKDSMLREYEAELKRLRQLLEAKKAGLPVPVPADAGSGSGQTAATVDVSKELMEQLKKQTDEEVGKILAEKGYAEQEIDKVREQMRHAAERSETEKKERDALERKLKAMEGKLIGGARSLVDENQRQRALLERQRLAIEQQQAEEARLKRELLQKKERKETLAAQVGGMEQTLGTVDSKLRELRTAYHTATQEIQELQEAFEHEREEALDRIRTLKSEIKLKSLIVRCFIPKEEVIRIERRIVFDDEKESYVLKQVSPRSLQLDRSVASSPALSTGSSTPVTPASPGDIPFRAAIALDMPEMHVQEYESNAAARMLEAQLQAAVTGSDDTQEQVGLRASENLPNLFLACSPPGFDSDDQIAPAPPAAAVAQRVPKASLAARAGLQLQSDLRARAMSDPPVCRQPQRFATTSVDLSSRHVVHKAKV